MIDSILGNVIKAKSALEDFALFIRFVMPMGKYIHAAKNRGKAKGKSKNQFIFILLINFDIDLALKASERCIVIVNGGKSHCVTVKFSVFIPIDNGFTICKRTGAVFCIWAAISHFERGIFTTHDMFICGLKREHFIFNEFATTDRTAHFVFHRFLHCLNREYHKITKMSR